MNKLKNVNISIDSRIISHLGEALIDNEKVALLELIKNSSDADANICTVRIDTSYESKYGKGRIIIEDDGIGMNPYVIENGYLRIATSIKQKYQKISPKFNRLAQGNKGIGRLALNQLGEFLKVTTRMDTSLFVDSSFLNEEELENIYGNREVKHLYEENLNAYHKFEIDWRKYENGGGSVENIGIELETKEINAEINIFNHKKKHGTRIEVLGLKGLSFWGNPKISKELESDVLAFLNPYIDEKANFRVSIDLDGQSFRSNRYDKKYIEKICDSSYVFSFNQDTKQFSYTLIRSKKYIKQKVDKLIYQMQKYDFDLVSEIDYKILYDNFSKVEKTILIDRIKHIKKNFPQSKIDDLYTFMDKNHGDNIYLPGSFNGEIYGFDFSPKSITSEVKQLVNTISGVKLYRNNFRIFPYGDNKNEWLGMSNYNARYQSVLFKTHTTTGYVDINGESNLELLEELTNRQGLVLNKYGSNFLKIMQEIVYKCAAIEDGILSNAFSFNVDKAKKTESNSIISVLGLNFKKRPNYREKASKRTENVFSGIVDIKKNLKNPNLLSNSEIELISSSLEKEVTYLKTDLNLIKMEFENKEKQVEDQNKYFAEMYPLIGASIISETLAHEIIRLSNNVKSYVRNIRSALNNQTNNDVHLHLKLIDSDIKFLARYASLLDVNSYSKRRRFENLRIGSSIEEIMNNSPLLEYKNMEVGYSISGHDFEGTLVKDSFKIIIENLFINSTYWLERNSIENPSVAFILNRDDKQLTVYDNGVGISSEVAQRLFEPFVTNKPEGDGRGMGLYIVSNLLHEIGASIEISNEKNSYDNYYKFIIKFAEGDL
ncbi:ATP-binding protein [Exiguobacterium profundum]